jgi:hypothetical protein
MPSSFRRTKSELRASSPLSTSQSYEQRRYSSVLSGRRVRLDLEVEVQRLAICLSSKAGPATMNDEGLADVEAASPFFRLPRLHPGIWLFDIVENRFDS